VGTAGTTSGGVIDPLPALRAVADRQAAWFHVDAAWGGAASLSAALRPALRGIETADSITWDAHKWLSVPMGAGMFFCRHPEAVRRAFATETAYMPVPSGDDTDDPYSVTPQWSRRAIGLKVFMTLAELGMPGMANLIDHQAAMGRLLREQLVASGWEVVNDTPLPLVCTTHPDARAGRLSLDTVVDVTRRHRKVWVSTTRLGGELPVIRACITSWRTEPGDVALLVEELAQARAAAA
jgi:glutamate/tyrosine decarboxylase-like PLP-dependent enzyme